MGITVETKIREIQMILINDERIPISSAKEINENLKVILLLLQKQKKNEKREK